MMSATNFDSNGSGMLSSSEMAGLIADALVVGGSIAQTSYETAEAKVTDVINMSNPPECREKERISSAELAALIVDALLMTGLVSPVSLERARGIATEEIDARRGIGDYA